MPRKTKKFRKSLLVKLSLLVLLIVVVASYVASVISANAEQEEIKKQEAAAKARLKADPLTVSGIYTAVNVERKRTGAHSLATLPNLTKSSRAFCSDMVKDDYFDYKNPKTKKKANSFISDYAGELYYKSYVTSIFQADTTKDTATDAVKNAVATQAENIENPNFNSVGWAVCSSPNYKNYKYIVGSFAEKAERPAAPTPVYTAPTYTPRTSIYCSTQYYSSLDSSSTSCF